MRVLANPTTQLRSCKEKHTSSVGKPWRELKESALSSEFLQLNATLAVDRKPFTQGLDLASDSLDHRFVTHVFQHIGDPV